MGFVTIFPFYFVNRSAVKVYINATTNPALYLLKTPENQRLHFQLNMVINIVGNKAKGRISKWVLQENKARQIF